ncbi:Retrovirus-related Pol poly from transposon, partial [Brachionus plicatilis]
MVDEKEEETVSLETDTSENAKIISQNPNSNQIEQCRIMVEGVLYRHSEDHHFTKLMILCLTKDANAITAAGNVVDEWACEYGIQEAVLSDGAKCFQSKLSDLVYDFLDIRRLKTTPFHPQCDGL